MRTDTARGGERRAARMHWWRQVLDRPSTVNRKDLFDEELLQRFCKPEDFRPSISQDLVAVSSW